MENLSKMPKKLPPTKNNADGYWLKNAVGEKIFYLAGKEIGNKFLMMKFIMSKYGISSSKAHKMVDKLNEKE